MLTPATRLLQKQREMHMVEEDLQRQKLEFQERMEVLGQRKEALRNKEQALADQLLRFDKFLKENDARRNRALKKTCDERELCLQKDEELTHVRAGSAPPPLSCPSSPYWPSFGSGARATRFAPPFPPAVAACSHRRPRSDRRPVLLPAPRH